MASTFPWYERVGITHSTTPRKKIKNMKVVFTMSYSHITGRCVTGFTDIPDMHYGNNISTGLLDCTYEA